MPLENTGSVLYRSLTGCYGEPILDVNDIIKKPFEENCTDALNQEMTYYEKAVIQIIIRILKEALGVGFLSTRGDLPIRL